MTGEGVKTAHQTGPGLAIPKLSGGLPFLGHALEFGKDPLTLLMRGYTEHGPVFEFLMAGQKFVLLAGPDGHDAFFRAPESQLSAREVYQFTVPIFGKGVAYDVDSERMAEQLEFLFPALKDRQMQKYADIMESETRQLLSTWNSQGEIDLPEFTNELTVNIASHCLLGEEIRGRLNTEFAELFHALQGGLNTIGFFAPRLPIPKHIKRDRARKEFSRLVREILDARRKKGIDGDDFMQALLNASYRHGSKLPDEEIIGLLLTVLFAGQHTSAVLSVWTIIELVRHPGYLHQVREEIKNTYSAGPALSLKALKQQQVLERAVRECERVHPPLIFLFRRVLETFTHGPYTVPENYAVAVSPLLSHCLPDVFLNPEKWDPDRYAEPRCEDKQYTHTLIGFGGGKHRCMGMHFAYMQIKAILTVLFEEYDLELINPDPEPDYGSWVTGPRTPCRARYSSRK